MNLNLYLNVTFGGDGKILDLIFTQENPNSLHRSPSTMQSPSFLLQKLYIYKN